MSRTPPDPDEIATTVELRRIQRLRDEMDVMDLAAMLATAFKAGHIQIEIADALRQRRLELKLRTWNPDGEESYE
jgi:hypothetical protein